MTNRLSGNAPAGDGRERSGALSGPMQSLFLDPSLRQWATKLRERLTNTEYLLDVERRNLEASWSILRFLQRKRVPIPAPHEQGEPGEPHGNR